MKLPSPRRAPLYLALLALSPAVWAQQDPRHSEATDLDSVVVKASPLARTAEDLSRPVEVLAGERLDAAKANSIGETVAKLPGVQSSYFGPGVGRPIIRGFDGARVQVLSDGLSSGDVSTVSVDHAVTIEPFLSNQIEVLKGPATLLYGSGAIGGAVNVVDGRIPEAVTAQPLVGRAELRGGTVNNEKTGMFRLDGTSASGNLVFHVDGLHRETGDYDIPGFAESAALLAEEGETPDPDTAGTLPNSALRTDSAALGLSWVGDRGFIGVGSSLFNTRYGVPGHAEHEEEHGDEEDHEEDEEGHDEEAPVRIVMDQRRTEIRGGLNDLGVFQSMRAKVANTDYTHTEFEGSDIGTVFESETSEARMELVHQPLLGWDGAIGAHWSQRDFLAIGAEAFVPGSQSRDTGLFWIVERAFGPATVELGVRHDRNRIELDEPDAAARDRAFENISGSAALRWNFSDAFDLSLGLDRAQRSPTSEELYSNGLHVATASVELGNPDLGVETANRAELGMHWHSGPLRIGAQVYHVRFDDFVYLADTGIADDGLPVRVWTQDDAKFTGAEAEVDWTFAENDAGAWAVRVFGDMVRGKLDGSGTRPLDFSVPHGDHSDDYSIDVAVGGNLPRIVPSRVGGELRWALGPWRASLGAVRYAEQDDVAAFETATPGYTLVDAHVAWHLDTTRGTAWEVFLDGRNLLDKEARVHSSFLKDLAPLPGRGVSFGVRAFF